MSNKNFRRGSLIVVAFIVALVVAEVSVPLNSVQAADFAAPEFKTLWTRTDKLVLDGSAVRTYMWGPEAFTAGTTENYAQSPGGKRLVQYFDKSRMEITNPNGDKNSPFYVTNGLLTRELITGQMQIGDATFEPRQPANINVAGDANDTTAPTYRSFSNLLGATQNATGTAVVTTLDRQGNTAADNELTTKYNVTNAYFVADTGHNIAVPFWTFLNQTGTVLNAAGVSTVDRLFDPVFYATGLPITEAYWTKGTLGGQVKDILVQAFERRVLTYTPSNKAEFQVEMGNVGRHYWQWRYGTMEREPATVIDNLDDFSKLSSYSPELNFDTTNPEFFEGDTSRLRRATVSPAEAVWALPGMRSFQAIAYFWPSEDVFQFLFFTSTDGKEWQPATPTVTGGDGNWRKFTYLLSNLKNVNYVKIQWSATGEWWNGQISKVIMTQ